jgi:simple sugar transport system permease protein
MEKIKKVILEDINLTILIGLTLCSILLSGAFMGNTMFSMANIQSMAFQIPEFGFLCIAMMLSNLIGGIDLSIIAGANTVAIFTAYVLNGQWAFGTTGIARILLGLLVAVITSILFGLFNGFLISKTSAPSLIATLGTMTLFRGIGMALTGGTSVGNITPEFSNIGKAKFLEIPVIFWLFLIIALLLGAIMSYTDFGRKLYLYGGNPIAARFSAIHNERMCRSVFVLTSLFAGIAGVIILSRVNSAKVGYGDSYLLQTMIVCVIGGIHPNGGRGKVQGVLIAIILMQIMSSAFTIMSLSPYTKKLIWGAMLIVVLGMNYLVSRVSVRRKRSLA